MYAIRSYYDVNAEASTQAPDDTKPIVLTPPKED